MTSVRSRFDVEPQDRESGDPAKANASRAGFVFSGQGKPASVGFIGRVMTSLPPACRIGAPETVTASPEGEAEL